ncbi:MAG: endonuclease/exonuclease/phosphatase family protein [Phycisphaerae bacterium]
MVTLQRSAAIALFIWISVVGCTDTGRNGDNANRTVATSERPPAKPVPEAPPVAPASEDASDSTRSIQTPTSGVEEKPEADNPEKKRELDRKAAELRAARLPAEPIADNADFLQRPSENSLRVVSYNIFWDHMYPDKDKSGAEKFARVFRALNPDIIGLQEIEKHSAEETVVLLNEIAPLPEGQTWYAFRGSRMMIASRYPFLLTDDAFDHPTYRDPAMVIVDLPDDRFPADVCVLNNHFKCCDGEENDPIRQKQADANMEWVRDAITPGGTVDAEPGSGIVILGDLNLVGGRQPLETLATGNISDEEMYGADFQPDWDGTALAIAELKHNQIGPDYTWRDDSQKWAPGRLDYIVYSDSVLVERNAFLLNTTTLSDEALSRAGLQKFDICLDDVGTRFDHFPLVVDFEMRARAAANAQ